MAETARAFSPQGADSSSEEELRFVIELLQQAKNVEAKWVRRFTRYLHVAGFLDRLCFIVPGDAVGWGPPGPEIF